MKKQSCQHLFLLQIYIKFAFLLKELIHLSFHLLIHNFLQNLLSLLLVAVYWLLVISSCDSLWLVVSSRDSLLLNYWPHRWVHLWLRMGCDSLNWLLRYMCWWGHHNILGFWSISLRVWDQSIELGNLIFRLLVDSFWLEVNHHQRVPGELVLT